MFFCANSSRPTGSFRHRQKTQAAPEPDSSDLKRRADGVVKMASRRPGAACFLALTPVALRAPSVTAKKHKQPQNRNLLCITTKKTSKTLDGCRSLFHTERALRRF